MAKRKQGGLEQIAEMPWPVGFLLGIIGFVVVRYGIGWFLTSRSNQPNSTNRITSSSRAMSWREFEMLVGEAFRRQGYAIQETGLGGADGGIDLVLRKDGKTTLVQCKQWKTQRVDVKVVREMFGLLTHHGAAAVKIVAVGDYTADAQRFAQGKAIELIHGEALLAMVHSVQTPIASRPVMPTKTSFAATSAERSQATKPVCAKCGNEMVLRSNRQTKDAFWGCTNYPKCRSTSAA
jgi:restriction system protein